MFDPAIGTQRVQLEREEARRQQETGALVVDQRRRRPLWFDGRFLTARDLRREQDYLLARQVDLSGALGAGVIQGLEVHADGSGRLLVGAGVGIARGGEHVVLPKDLNVDPRELASAAVLDRAFGLDALPATPDRARSGIYALLLRPVEFTANPEGSYPAAFDQPRQAEDGEIVEGALLTLAPLAEGLHDLPARERAWLAARIFRDGSLAQLPPGALPLAAVGLDANRVRWVDQWLLRRETEDDALLALGGADRATRVALLRHYRDLLGDGQAAPAAELFRLLPPAGPLPAGRIERDRAGAGLVQTFFPPEVAVQLSVIPADELPALIEESLALPLFDLEADAERRAADAACILIPVPREQLRATARRLGDLNAPLAGTGRKRELAANLRLLERTQLRRLGRAGLSTGETTGSEPAPTAVDAWMEVIAAAGELWYVRRRQLARSTEVLPLAIAVDDEDDAVDHALRERIDEWQLRPAYDAAHDALSTRARGDLVEGLTANPFAVSWLLTARLLSRVAAERPDRGALNALRSGLAARRDLVELEHAVVPTSEPWRIKPLLADDRDLQIVGLLPLLAEDSRKEATAGLGELLRSDARPAAVKKFVAELEQRIEAEREIQLHPQVRALAEKLGLQPEIATIATRADRSGAEAIAKLHQEQQWPQQLLLAAASLIALSQPAKLDAAAVAAAVEPYAGDFGSGIAELSRALRNDPAGSTLVARSGRVAQLDRKLLEFDPDRRRQAFKALLEATRRGEQREVDQIVVKVLAMRPVEDDPRPVEPRPSEPRPSEPRPSEPRLDEPVDLGRRLKVASATMAKHGLAEHFKQALASTTTAHQQALLKLLEDRSRATSPLLLQGLLSDLASVPTVRGRDLTGKVIEAYAELDPRPLTRFAMQLVPARTPAAKRVELLEPLASAQLVVPLAQALAGLDAAAHKKLAAQIQALLKRGGDAAALKKAITSASRNG